MENKTPPKNNHRHPGVTHHIGSRTRYRLAKKHRSPKTLKQVREAMMGVSGVKDVEMNERTGSILVHHVDNPEILGLLETVLDSIGIDLFEGLFGEEIILASGISFAANLVKSRISKVDSYIAQATNNYLDLKTLVPMLFLGAGLYQSSRNKGWLSQMPAYVLFWYAFDSYMKFHGNPSHTMIPGNGQKNRAS